MASKTIHMIDPKDIRVQKDQRIGKEGMYGEIYQGVYKGTPVAVKIPKDLTNETYTLFDREVYTTLSLQLDHPAIVKYFGCCKVDSSTGLVMELEHSNLRHALGKTIQTIWEVYQVISDVMEGLVYLHNRNIIHRDIKPDNILITRRKRAKLCDFGFARLIDRADEYISVAGSNHYLAPEVKTGKYDERADVYSFGRVLQQDIMGNMHVDTNDRELGKIKDACLVNVQMRPTSKQILRKIQIAYNMSQEDEPDIKPPRLTGQHWAKCGCPKKARRNWQSRRQEIFEKLDGRCIHCGEELDEENWHIEHYKALAKCPGHEDEYDQFNNLFPACPECNVKGHGSRNMRSVWNDPKRWPHGFHPPSVIRGDMNPSTYAEYLSIYKKNYNIRGRVPFKGKQSLNDVFRNFRMYFCILNSNLKLVIDTMSQMMMKMMMKMMKKKMMKMMLMMTMTTMMMACQ